MAAEYFAPCAAYGQASTRILTAGSEPSAGDSIIYLNNADGAYAVGDLVFVGESDNSEPQFLGEVKTAGALSIATELDVQSDLSAGAKIWKPVQGARLSPGPGFDVRHYYNPGTRSRVSRGGIVYSTNIADAYERLLFRWSKKGRLADFKAFRTFIYGSRRNGVDNLTLAYFNREAQAHAIVQARMDFTPLFEEEEYVGVAVDEKDSIEGAYVLSFYILAEGTYVTS